MIIGTGGVIGVKVDSEKLIARLGLESKNLIEGGVSTKREC